jgi:hypothetical protein
MFLLEFGRQNHLFDQRKGLFYVFLQARELENDIEILISSNGMEDIESSCVVGKLRGERVVGEVLS